MILIVVALVIAFSFILFQGIAIVTLKDFIKLLIKLHTINSNEINKLRDSIKELKEKSK